jgi:hypothetical protein
MARYLGTSSIFAGAPVLSSLCCIRFHCISGIHYRNPGFEGGTFLTASQFDCSLNYVQTLPSLVTKRRTESLERIATRDVADENIALINHRDSLDYDPTPIQIQSSSSESTPIQQDKPPLLNRGLVMIYLNNAFLAFLQMGHFSLLPLFYSTSIPSGGLGLDPSKIGIVMGAYGFVNAIVQATFLGSLIRKFGARKLYIICFPALFGCYALYPIMRHLVERSGRVNHLVIFCMIVQLSFQVVAYPSSGIYLYLTQASSSDLTTKKVL